MTEKFGIIYNPSKEWVSWYNKDKKKYVIFDEDKEKVSSALSDLLFSDGGYDGDTKDFTIKSVSIVGDNDFDGSSVVEQQNNSVFIDNNLI